MNKRSRGRVWKSLSTLRSLYMLKLMEKKFGKNSMTRNISGRNIVKSNNISILSLTYLFLGVLKKLRPN